MKTKTRFKDESKAIHITSTVYPVAVDRVKQLAEAEDRSVAQAAAILIEEGWAARQARQQTTQA